LRTRTSSLAAASSAPASRTTTSPRSDVRDRLDLHERAARKRADADRGASRGRVADVAGVHLVHAGEVVEIEEEYRRLREPVETASGGFEDRAQIPHDLLRLLLHGRPGELSRRELDSELTRDEDEVADA